MRRFEEKEPRVKAIAIRENKGWLWIVITLMLLAIMSTSLAACSTTPAATISEGITIPAEVSVDEAYELYKEGVFFLDVRTQEEWDEYHAPNTTLIPLDQLENRINELPKDEQIVVVCRSGNRSQVGRDILLSNGIEQATSMAGGLSTWRASGYPIE